MDASDHYIVIEKMIRLGELSMSDLQHLLDSLEEQGRISRAQQQALLEVAKELSRNEASPSKVTQFDPFGPADLVLVGYIHDRSHSSSICLANRAAYLAVIHGPSDEPAKRPRIASWSCKQGV